MSVGKRVVVTIEPFASVTRGLRRDAELEAERVATFVGGDLELAWV